MTEAELLSALGKELNVLRAAGADYEIVATSPRPVVLIEWTDSWQEQEFDLGIMCLVHGIGEVAAGSDTCMTVRCVEIDRLRLILQRGCDVEPTNSVLWTDRSPGKALEYGKEQKVMMVFDIRRTEPSYQQVPADTDQSTLDELRKTYPTIERSRDGSMLWLSRLPEHDRRVTTPYEVEHGRWIPGDPFEALAAILVLGRDMARLRNVVQSCIATCDQPVWKLQEANA